MELVLARLLGCGDSLLSLDFVFALRFLGGIVANLDGWLVVVYSVNSRRIGRRMGDASGERVLHHAKSYECAKGTQNTRVTRRTVKKPHHHHRRRKTITNSS